MEIAVAENFRPGPAAARTAQRPENPRLHANVRRPMQAGECDLRPRNIVPGEPPDAETFRTRRKLLRVKTAAKNQLRRREVE